MYSTSSMLYSNMTDLLTFSMLLGHSIGVLSNRAVQCHLTPVVEGSRRSQRSWEKQFRSRLSRTELFWFSSGKRRCHPWGDFSSRQITSYLYVGPNLRCNTFAPVSMIAVWCPRVSHDPLPCLSTHNWHGPHRVPPEAQVLVEDYKDDQCYQSAGWHIEWQDIFVKPQ